MHLGLDWGVHGHGKLLCCACGLNIGRCLVQALHLGSVVHGDCAIGDMHLGLDRGVHGHGKLLVHLSLTSCIGASLFSRACIPECTGRVHPIVCAFWVVVQQQRCMY